MIQWIKSVYEGEGVEFSEDPLLFTPGCRCVDQCSSGSKCDCFGEMDGGMIVIFLDSLCP